MNDAFRHCRTCSRKIPLSSATITSGVNAARIPCDFMAIHERQITLVRVRRVRYACHGLPDITLSCTREILELLGIPVSENTTHELWVRGPDRHWHRYVIFPNRREVLDWDIFGVRSLQQFGQQILPVG